MPCTCTQDKYCPEAERLAKIEDDAFKMFRNSGYDDFETGCYITARRARAEHRDPALRRRRMLTN